MNDKDTGHSRSRNPELDELLTEFFQSELPEELQNPDRLFRQTAERPARRRRQTGLLGIFAATALLLFVVSFLWKPFEPQGEQIAQNPPRETGISTAAPTLEDRLAEDNRGLADLRGAAEEGILSRDLNEMETMNSQRFLMYGDEFSAEYTEVVKFESERYQTPAGPVEQRNTVYVSTKTVADPSTGNGLVLSIPELEIVVFPVDENDEKKGK